MSEEVKQELRSWMEESCLFQGVLGVGLGSIDGTAFGKFIAPEFVVVRTQGTWRLIADAIRHLRDSGVPIDEILWTFEEALLWSVCREDGLWLGVFTTKTLPTDSIQLLEKRFDEFRSKQ